MNSPQKNNKRSPQIYLLWRRRELKQVSCTPRLSLRNSLCSTKGAHRLEDSLARSSGKEREIMERSWLVFSVSLAYILRKDLLDPLQTVEEVYADFDYPEQIASFVRYMPMQGPDLGSRLANERRLFERWRSWVVENNPHVTIP